jgi:hypothetical protein
MILPVERLVTAARWSGVFGNSRALPLACDTTLWDRNKMHAVMPGDDSCGWRGISNHEKMPF